MSSCNLHEGKKVVNDFIFVQLVVARQRRVEEKKEVEEQKGGRNV